MARAPLAIMRANEISVSFYGNEITLERRESLERHFYRASDVFRSYEDCLVGEPYARSLTLQQGGSMNRWCARFDLRSPSHSLVQLEAWDDDPDEAVHQLVLRMQQAAGLLGWS